LSRIPFSYSEKWEDFSKQKIMYSEIVQEPQFYLDKFGKFFPEATTFIMTGKNLEYLTDILNSRIVAYFFKTFYAGGGLGETGYRYKKIFLENLPIPPVTKLDKGDIEGSICTLYGLTADEINSISSILRL
jgi:hypothetical protein